jgi:hypothetical protein
MTEKPPKTRPPDNFAAFDPLSHGCRRVRWALRPAHEPSEGATADASRFVTEAKLMQGLGRKPVKE